MTPPIPDCYRSNFLRLPMYLLLVSGCTSNLLAQEPPSPVGAQDSSPATTTTDTAESTKLVSQQIARLSDSRYQVRLLAKTVIEQHPYAALKVIEQEIHNIDSVVGVQLIDLISGIAMHSDLTISSKAIELLHSLANEATSVGRGAGNSLSAIADLQEEKAVEILTHYGAYIGPLNFSLNGKLEQYSTKLALRIDDSFHGTDAELKWVRFLKSIDVAYLRGRKISAATVEATSRLKQLRAIRLHGIDLKPQQLLLFKELEALEHLGLSYVDVHDVDVSIITQLPITQSIRLYGTKVTEVGEQQLLSHFQGLEVFRGSGGFLGISSTSNSTVIDVVTPNSAAALAGILREDRIMALNGVPVKTFDQLRGELGKYQAGDEVEIVLERFKLPIGEDEIKTQTLTVKAILQEES